jgi:hypothetical protein
MAKIAGCRVQTRRTLLESNLTCTRSRIRLERKKILRIEVIERQELLDDGHG